MELDRPGAAARDRRRGSSTASARSIRPTAATRIATAARSSGSGPRNNASTKVSAYGIGYDLNLFSNFTYFLDDPDHGDQFQQADHRFVTGARVSHRRIGRWAGRAVQNTFGVQLRNDDISNVGLYHTGARALLETVREDAVLQTSAAAYAQNEIAWTPWLRTLAGVRVDGYRFDVEAGDPANCGIDYAGLASPKGGAVIGPFDGTEFYVNAGLGFHSNDARGATITVRSGDRRGRRSRDAARPRQGRRGRRPHRRASRSCRPASRSGR